MKPREWRGVERRWAMRTFDRLSDCYSPFNVYNVDSGRKSHRFLSPSKPLV